MHNLMRRNLRDTVCLSQASRGQGTKCKYCIAGQRLISSLCHGSPLHRRPGTAIPGRPAVRDSRQFHRRPGTAIPGHPASRDSWRLPWKDGLMPETMVTHIKGNQGCAREAQLLRGSRASPFRCPIVSRFYCYRPIVRASIVYVSIVLACI